ncbi:MAG: HAMP domain-containing histidine kinase [Treponema sp.]|nr:HAMP domain-containing histidine kinase [Treponema sp.]
MKKTLALKLSIKFMLFVALIVMLVAMVFVFALRLSIRKKQSQDLKRNAEILCKEISAQENPVIESLNLDYFISYIVFDDEGQVWYTNDSLLPELELTEGKAKKYFQKNFYFDGDLNLLYCSIRLPTGLTVQTSIDTDQDASIQMINTLPKVGAIALIPILLISFLLSFLISKRTLKPVEAMTGSAKKIYESNLEALLPVSKNNDELDILAETFNQLFEDLKEDFERESRFTSDVSHELKTPVAGILGHAKLIKRWGKNDPKQLEESVDMIISEANSMDSIITNLLQTSKLEKGIVKPDLSEVNLWGLFSRIKNEFSVISQEAEIHFDENLNVILKTDIELLHQVLTAVVSNSLKFGAGTIELSACETQDGKIEIKVSDNGPGFSEESLPHVFERFFRSDKAHTRSAGGAGLGLSISASIISALGGKIRAQNCPDHTGAEIIITL